MQLPLFQPGQGTALPTRLESPVCSSLQKAPKPETAPEPACEAPAKETHDAPSGPPVSLAEAMDFSLGRLDEEQAASVRGRAGGTLGMQMDLARSLFGGL